MNWKQWFGRKRLTVLLQEAADGQQLRRVLGPVALTSLGVGAIIGAGIFVMTGRAAAIDAGPSIMISYCVAGLGCLFAALCYAEFAAMAPVAGSAYTYATLGEIFAWITSRPETSYGDRPDQRVPKRCLSTCRSP